jgi:hypothetical protein
MTFQGRILQVLKKRSCADIENGYHSSIFLHDNEGGRAVRKSSIIMTMTLVCCMALACGQEFGIKEVSPAVGALGGGEQVVIVGTGFNPEMGVAVFFGNRQADTVVVSSRDKLIVMTPASQKAETVDIRIALDDGSEYLIKQGFRYVEKASMDIRDLGKRTSRRNQ